MLVVMSRTGAGASTLCTTRDSTSSPMRARAPDQRAHQHVYGCVVERDQPAPGRPGREHAGGNGAAADRDEDGRPDTVGDFDQPIRQELEILQQPQSSPP